MPQAVNVPGIGQLNFPDGMSQPDMAAAIQKNFPQIHAGTAPVSDGKAQGQRIMADIDQANHEQGKGSLGLGEVALNAATGLGSSVVGGLRGLASVATGGSLDDASKAIQDTQQDYTYQPRTGVGKLGSELLTVPVMVAKSMGSSIGGDIGQFVGGDQGRVAGESIGNVAPDLLATLAGGRAAVRSLNGKAPIASPIAAPAPEVAQTAANLDVPTYFRNGGAPVETTPIKPIYTPSQLAQEMDRMNMARAVTPSQLKQEMAQMKARQEAPIAAPEPAAAPPIGTPTQAATPAESAPIPGPAAKITAPLRDNSDIDGVLQQFGINAPDAPPTAEPIRSPASSAAAPDVAEQPFTPTLERHVDPALRDQNLQTLRDVGLENIRESAVSGDAAAAAREFQHGKFTSEPAGQHWNDQFQHETDAMKNYGQQLVDDSGGRTGLDGEAMEHKGRDIAAPYDAMRKYFEDAKANLYDVADKAAAGKPLTSTENLDGLLADRGFNNTALADKQLDLVKAVQNQFELHKERNAGLMTVKEAEDFRKWLNKRWTPENSQIIGTIKDALDKDVFAAAGEDVYASARRLHQEESRVMDDPHGISKLMDSDPRAPINRATPYEAIPNKLLKLSNEQFKHIVDTYKGLPPELQPLAQKAIDTMKSHLAERMLNSGTETLKGNPRGLWDAGGVKNFVAQNSAKLPMVFDAADLARIQKMLDAGEILRVNPAYPGAAAQLANASKAGMMSKLLGRVGGGIGGAVGAVAGGPGGAAAGGFVGDAAASSLLKLSSERKALAKAKAAVINVHRKAPAMRTPIDEWEDATRH